MIERRLRTAAHCTAIPLLVRLLYITHRSSDSQKTHDITLSTHSTGPSFLPPFPFAFALAVAVWVWDATRTEIGG